MKRKWLFIFQILWFVIAGMAFTMSILFSTNKTALAVGGWGCALVWSIFFYIVDDEYGKNE